MSEAATDQSKLVSGEFRTPEQAQAEAGRDVPAAHELALEDINPLNANLFKEDRWQGFPVVWRPEEFYREVCRRHGLELSIAGRLRDWGHAGGEAAQDDQPIIEIRRALG